MITTKYHLLVPNMEFETLKVPCAYIRIQYERMQYEIVAPLPRRAVRAQCAKSDCVYV